MHNDILRLANPALVDLEGIASRALDAVAAYFDVIIADRDAKKLRFSAIVGIGCAQHGVAPTFHETNDQVGAGCAIVIENDVDMNVARAADARSSSPQLRLQWNYR